MPVIKSNKNLQPSFTELHTRLQKVTFFFGAVMDVLDGRLVLSPTGTIEYSLTGSLDNPCSKICWSIPVVNRRFACLLRKSGRPNAVEEA